MNEVKIEFDNEEQLKAFMKWFIDWGFDDLCMSDSALDDLSSDDFYDEIEHIPGGFKIT